MPRTSGTHSQVLPSNSHRTPGPDALASPVASAHVQEDGLPAPTSPLPTSPGVEGGSRFQALETLREDIDLVAQISDLKAQILHIQGPGARRKSKPSTAMQSPLGAKSRHLIIRNPSAQVSTDPGVVERAASSSGPPRPSLGVVFHDTPIHRSHRVRPAPLHGDIIPSEKQKQVYQLTKRSVIVPAGKSTDMEVDPSSTTSKS